ncbi:MAG: flagellar motor protein MotB [Myxococcales bacterium]
MALRRGHAEEHVNTERWLVSYADFITLLFAFFTVMYAISTVDGEKAALASHSVREALGLLGVDRNGDEALLQPPIESPIIDARFVRSGRDVTNDRLDDIILLNDLTRFIEVNALQSSLRVEMTARGVVITLAEAGFFDSGSAKLKESAYAAFAQLALLLVRYQPELAVEGHTDDRPTRGGRFRSNWELSTARALSVVQALIDDFGYRPDRLGATGFGEHRPVASNDTEAQRARNRRIELIVLPQSNAVAKSATWNQVPGLPNVSAR